MSDAAVAMTASVIHSRLGSRGEKPLKDLALEVFKMADSETYGWMCGSDDEIFRGGCGALLLLTTGDERARIETELKMLQGLSALQRGIPVDMAALIPDGFEAIGLLGIFRERNK